MKKPGYRRGEMLIESLIAMLIIAMTGMMLAMAAASSLRANAKATQIVAPIDSGTTFTASASFVLEDDSSVTTAPISVTVSEQGGTYCYELPTS